MKQLKMNEGINDIFVLMVMIDQASEHLCYRETNFEIFEALNESTYFEHISTRN